MPTMLRPLVIGAAFAAMVAAGVTALTLSGETKEAGFVEDACAKAAWPLVPAKCLDGGRGAEVRVVGGVSTDGPAPGASAMAERFNSDFEVTEVRPQAERQVNSLIRNRSGARTLMRKVESAPADGGH